MLEHAAGRRLGLDRIESWLHVSSETKPKVYAQIFESAEITSVTYWLELIFSAGIATFGLVLNSPAVIIGAMLISPLMGPIMATGLALAVGDLYLGLKSALNLAASVAASIALAGILVWLLPFHSPTPEILARIHPNLLDLGVAILSGLAGSVLICRNGGSGAALPGVAIAVALTPPLCTIGFGFGSSFNREIMGGAALLFLTNLVAIVASAFLLFLLIRMDSPDVRAQIHQSMHDHAEKEALYRALQRTGLAGLLDGIGKLQWRAVMLVVPLAVLFVPLRTALIQVKNETVARSAVQEAIRNMGSSGLLVSQQVQINPDDIRIDLVSTAHIPPATVTEAEGLIQRRTGSKALISVREVASKNELTEILQKIAVPPPLPPAPKDLGSIRSDLVARIAPAVKDLWPENIPLQKYELGFGPDGLVLHLFYESRTPLGDVPGQLLKQSFSSRLNAPNLTVDLVRVRPQRK
jgi:uncharacterized hydrophobic protein (TIGR00271 family)